MVENSAAHWLLSSERHENPFLSSLLWHTAGSVLLAVVPLTGPSNLQLTQAQPHCTQHACKLQESDVTSRELSVWLNVCSINSACCQSTRGTRRLFLMALVNIHMQDLCSLTAVRSISSVYSLLCTYAEAALARKIFHQTGSVCL